MSAKSWQVCTVVSHVELLWNCLQSELSLKLCSSKLKEWAYAKQANSKPLQGFFKQLLLSSALRGLIAYKENTCNGSVGSTALQLPCSGQCWGHASKLEGKLWWALMSPQGLPYYLPLKESQKGDRLLLKTDQILLKPAFADYCYCRFWYTGSEVGIRRKMQTLWCFKGSWSKTCAFHLRSEQWRCSNNFLSFYLSKFCLQPKAKSHTRLIGSLNQGLQKACVHKFW